MAEDDKSVSNLVARLKNTIGVEKQAEQDLENMRYVAYVRKSTDDGVHQLRSIGDQIKECRDLAIRIGVGRVPIVPEEQSAKISDKRPKFRQMLNDIVDGKYDGIIAWAPDRLARNMKEGGEIIDLLDRGVIKDIKFANNYMFSNDPSGKMLLGIAFVMAKQYSDQHGQNVKRGFDHLTEDGKCGGAAKHGYYKDQHKFLQPDGENWTLIKRAFEMRLDKKSLKEISEFLEEAGYPLQTKHSKRTSINVNVKFVSDMFRDPFYAGAMVRGDKIIELSKKYKFTPIITSEQFDEMTTLDKISKTFRLTEAIKERGSVRADLMRKMIICAHCKRFMSASINEKHTTLKSGERREINYLRYRCDTGGCKRKGKTVRAKIICDAAFEFLKTHPMNINEGYEAYAREMERQAVLQGTDVATRLQSLKQRRVVIINRKSIARQDMEEYAPDPLMRKEFASEFRNQTQLLKDIDKLIDETEQEKEGKKSANKSLMEFIELFNNLTKVIQNYKHMEDLDYVMKKVFSNFETDGKKVTKITQNSPFRELCEPVKAVNCTNIVLTGIEPVFLD